VRILAIRGENLASLGRFEVELGHGPLGGAGLFAITGPTGAGKSTLLDALCLALFDRTPRLDGRGGVPIGRAEVAERDRVLSNDVRALLRRGATSGFAEVDFAGKDARRYRARWSVRRARQRADGRLQAQEVVLTELASGRVVGGGKLETLAAIEERLGLSFEQFRRSALLAQGEFAAFLRADKNERAELLERMTGTALYGEVSALAYRRAAEEDRTLAGLEAAIASHAVLPDDERAALVAAREVGAAELAAARRAVTAAEAELAWHGRQAELAGWRRQAGDEAARAAAARVEAAPLEAELAAVEAARELAAPVAELDRAVAAARAAELVRRE
jgi:DNA repair protein SbcC/Rad50